MLLLLHETLDPAQLPDMYQVPPDHVAHFASHITGGRRAAVYVYDRSCQHLAARLEVEEGEYDLVIAGAGEPTIRAVDVSGPPASAGPALTQTDVAGCPPFK